MAHHLSVVNSAGFDIHAADARSETAYNKTEDGHYRNARAALQITGTGHYRRGVHPGMRNDPILDE